MRQSIQRKENRGIFEHLKIITLVKEWKRSHPLILPGSFHWLF